MKKTLLSICVFCAAILAANAQVFMENFETATAGGNLEGYNEWYVSKKVGDNYGASPKVAAGSLSYTAYASSGMGNVAVLDPLIGDESATQRISTKIVTFGEEPLNILLGEKVYVAFLAKFSVDSKKALRDFFTLEGSATSSMTRGRVFVKTSSEGEINFGLSKNTGTAAQIVESAQKLSVDDTHLLVFVYEALDGESNDKVKLYINPDLSKTEAQQTNLIEATDSATDYAEAANVGINLRQRAVGVSIGGIRVAKNWADVLGQSLTSIENGEVDNGNVISTKYYNLSGVEVNEPVNTNIVYIKKDVYENGSTVTSKVIK